jgi:hypothetical protein
MIAITYLTESSLPPELLGYLADYDTILIPDRYSVFELLTDVAFIIETILGLLAAVGLILFRPWGRPVFLIYVAAGLLITLITGPHVSTGWTALFGYACGIVEGAIVALAYFSPIREMFEDKGEVKEFLK